MESKFESSIKEIATPQQKVYDVLSDLKRLEQMKERMKGVIDDDKLDNFSFDHDTMTANVPPVGGITLRIVEREEPKTIKFETEQSPMPFNFWIQLLPLSDETCKMKLTIKADLNPFLKGMISKPLSEALEKMAETIAAINYNNISIDQ